ncbi:NADP-dependent oxidoreductase domain-containing protein [Neurospora tetraspora]|uniref:NADP-dependent oxidoreductase domain-containing protein n=1 Tax=Neurospora tetraspora TaxID=94610 RepID=A0AAE0JF58_9PEZI|nr:NADP-dependent oxidoreductase domain-containing protein [Neurospora tetraspora]
MNSATSNFEVDATGVSPKQLDGLIPSLKLADGNEVPMLGYGLGTANYKSGSAGDAISEPIVTATLTALKAGYTHLDGAEVYGNEVELGKAIEQSRLPRSSLFITTKTIVHAGDTVTQSFNRSLEKLGLDYVDLYLLHSPFFAKTPEELHQAWREMEKIKDSGMAKSIGVSNFLISHLQTLFEIPGGFVYPPVVNQIEYHPYLQHVVEGEDLIAYCREKNIAIQAYSPLTAITNASPGPVDPIYTKLAKKYGVSEAEVALRWCLDQGIVTLTTSSNEERLKGYLKKLPSFKLTPKEVEDIAAAGKEKHHRVWWTENFDANDRR